MQRREFIKASAAMSMLLALPRRWATLARSREHIVVVGAGAFGGWTALSLLRSGARVTPIDAWGAGHSRASSGDETRLIRTMYDGDRVYIDLVVRAFALWRDAEASWGRKVFCRTGALYTFAGDDGFAT